MEVPLLLLLALSLSGFCVCTDYRFIPTSCCPEESTDPEIFQSNMLMGLNSRGRRKMKMAWCYYSLMATFGHVIWAIKKILNFLIIRVVICIILVQLGFPHMIHNKTSILLSLPKFQVILDFSQHSMHFGTAFWKSTPKLFSLVIIIKST